MTTGTTAGLEAAFDPLLRKYRNSGPSPWGKVKESRRSRAPKYHFPLRRGEGGSPVALLPAAARRVRGHFPAFSADSRIASSTMRTNSSACSNTIELGIRNNRMPSVRK